MRTLEDLLREDAKHLVHDGGFSERVMAAIPSRRARAHAWLRPMLVMGSAVVGSLLAVILSPAIESPVAALTELLTSGVLSQAGFASLAIGGVLLASALVVAFDPD